MTSKLYSIKFYSNDTLTLPRTKWFGSYDERAAWAVEQRLTRAITIIGHGNPANDQRIGLYDV